jgi:hypothetical protein
MACKSCQSSRQTEFPAEINVHFPGKENLDKASVCLLPKLWVCLDCGFTEFSVPESELLSLATGNPPTKSAYRRRFGT